MAMTSRRFWEPANWLRRTQGKTNEIVETLSGGRSGAPVSDLPSDKDSSLGERDRTLAIYFLARSVRRLYRLLNRKFLRQGIHAESSGRNRVIGD